MKRRTKKGRSGGKPGKENPVRTSCGRGHTIWVKAGGSKRCPYCRGKKQYKEVDNA
jgi:hypothetical protein